VDFFPGVRQRPRKEQLKILAAFLERSVNTIERWEAAGCDIYDADSVLQFYQWNKTRQRNRKPDKRRPLRVRSPLD
jgi:hypothetical protein